MMTDLQYSIAELKVLRRMAYLLNKHDDVAYWEERLKELGVEVSDE